MLRAAQHGNANAQHTLAKMLLNGEGRERNAMEAKKWLHRSAENGSVRAQLLLVYLAARGGTESDGVPDLATADMWFWAASRKNVQLANDIRSKLVPLIWADEVLRARRMKSNYTSLLALLPSGMSGSADELDAANDSLRNAAAAGNVNDLLKALSQGADVDGKDDDGRTAMLNAAWNADPAIVDMLLQFGSDPARRDKNGRTALDHAIREGHGEIAARLKNAAPLR